MLTKLFGVITLAAGMTFGSLSWADGNVGTGCCTKPMACCGKDKACCTAPAKPGCCAKAMKCCEQGQACCAAAQECCRLGSACCDDAKACCSLSTQKATKTAAKDCCPGSDGCGVSGR